MEGRFYLLLTGRIETGREMTCESGLLSQSEASKQISNWMSTGGENYLGRRGEVAPHRVN